MEEDIKNDIINNNNEKIVILSLGCALLDLVFDSETFENNLSLEKNIKNEYKDKIEIVKKLSQIKDKNDITSVENKEYLKNLVINNYNLTQLGGCTTNTIRLLTFLLNKIEEEEKKEKGETYKSIFICSIGDDFTSKEYWDKLIKEDIIPIGNIVENRELSFCIPFIINNEKTFFNNIEVTKKINIELIYSVIEYLNLLNKEKIKEKNHYNTNRENKNLMEIIIKNKI